MLAHFTAAVEAGVNDVKLVLVPLTGTFTATGTTAVIAPRNAFTQANGTAAIVTPSAAPKVGETWTVNLPTGAFSHVVAIIDSDGDPKTPGTRLETTAEILADLATRISLDASAGYTAFVDGNVLVIARIDAASLAATTFTIAPDASIGFDTTTPTDSRITLAGTPHRGRNVGASS